MSERKLWRPSNATEFQIFMGVFCYSCAKDTNDDCGIISDAMLDEEPVEAWTYDAEGRPICVEYQSEKERKRLPEYTEPRCPDTPDLFGDLVERD